MEMMNFVAVPVEFQPEYARLLSNTLPSVIHSEAQNEEYLEQVAVLLRREEMLTNAEKEFVRLLTLLIEDFEEKNYALPKAGPLEVIAFLMDQHGLKQKDLTTVFGTRSITSEVLSGKRDLNKEQIRRLSERFHVSPELFF
jgi:HTH-type transcriptional regulator/antitoxin HigA